MKKKEVKHVMSVEDALAIAVKAWETGVAPFIIAGSLLNDGFSQKQTETIMRWAYLKVRREQNALQKPAVGAQDVLND